MADVGKRKTKNGRHRKTVDRVITEDRERNTEKNMKTEKRIQRKYRRPKTKDIGNGRQRTVDRRKAEEREWRIDKWLTYCRFLNI